MNFLGDLVGPPLPGHSEPYGILTSVMTDSLVDKYPGASMNPDFHTFNHQENTYYTYYDTDYSNPNPTRQDHIMFWSSSEVDMCTRDFSLRHDKTRDSYGKLISLSDHEPVTAEFKIRKKQQQETDVPFCEKDTSYTPGNYNKTH